MTRDEFTKAVEENNKRVFLIALSFTKNNQDAEDIMQNVFLKLWNCKISFENDEHIAKWLTIVTSNESKNLLKYYQRKRTEPITEVGEEFYFDEAEDRDLFNAVMSLSPKIALVIHLFYYEDMSVRDIAKTLKISESVVKTRLCRGREKLKELLGGIWINE